VIRQSWREDFGESEVKGLIPQVVDEYTVKLTPNGFVCPSEESTRAGQFMCFTVKYKIGKLLNIMISHLISSNALILWIG